MHSPRNGDEVMGKKVQRKRGLESHREDAYSEVKKLDLYQR